MSYLSGEGPLDITFTTVFTTYGYCKKLIGHWKIKPLCTYGKPEPMV